MTQPTVTRFTFSIGCATFRVGVGGVVCAVLCFYMLRGRREAADYDVCCFGC